MNLATIHQLDFLDYENGIISLEVSCSKGTYIRSLIPAQYHLENLAQLPSLASRQAA
jgi:tRNA U55 pseudouridine synthase TruB